jgi:NRAMP (natural resistance-associated macrophage protein)-like metal ion transporter
MFKKFFKRLGPGFITGAADDDPSGIATYSQTGAQFGFSLLWTALFALPFMTVVQEMCGRIGMVTGDGLAGVIRKNYAKPILYGCVFLLIVANTINIGADLGAMAATLRLFIPIPFEILLVGMMALTLVLEIFVSYPKYAAFLKYLTLSLFAYVVTAFIIKPDWGEILRATIFPTVTFSFPYLLNIVALLGTIISPYLFFWQTDEEVEEEIDRGEIKGRGLGRPKLKKGEIRNMRIDTVVGMIFANVITFFIIAAAASTLYTHGITNVETANQAAEAIRPFGGDFTFLFFALGIVGTGLLAVPILAGSVGYAVSESIGWRAGLYLKLKQAHGFYGVITIATILGLIVNFLGIPPFTVLYYTAIANGLAAPALIVIILLIANNKKIMGVHTNRLASNLLGGLIAAIMAVSGILVVLGFLI